MAVLGSIVAQVYRSQLSPHAALLPAAARSAASGSITATQAVASRFGPAGLRLDGFADTAFVHAMHVTSVISAAITLAGALVVLAWMPGRSAAGRADRDVSDARTEVSEEAAAAGVVAANAADREAVAIRAVGADGAEG